MTPADVIRRVVAARAEHAEYRAALCAALGFDAEGVDPSGHYVASTAQLRRMAQHSGVAWLVSEPSALPRSW